MAAPEASNAPAHSVDAAVAVGDDELDAPFAPLADYPVVIAAVSECKPGVKCSTDIVDDKSQRIAQ